MELFNYQKDREAEKKSIKYGLKLNKLRLDEEKASLNFFFTFSSLANFFFFAFIQIFISLKILSRRMIVQIGDDEELFSIIKQKKLTGI